ncbi:hypothetical protein M0805_002691 [Coniferiporia weirii]|nr:hypothetical protein M0805_002691 [Coniferiporia weirii]
MPRHLLLLLIVFLIVLPGASAFGAGSIPNYAYLHDRAFRHGDIENLLTTLAKSPHHHAGGSGGLVDFFSTLASKGLGAILHGSAASTFSKSDVRRIYFGNWLRDYSQAIDVAGLSKMTHDTLLIVVQALGFMSFGFATREFHITPERLGVYLPVEHIDNPKGYAAREGDARRFDPRLRPPVDPRELEIDKRNGMKKYMATEGRSWDTSTAHIRRTLRACIALGRRVHAGRRRVGRDDDDDDGGDDPDDCEEMWEAFRLLGTALHTLEDLLAHSNWCEIALRRLGYRNVFCHVGDRVRIRTPNGVAPPLVTGTFGSADFLFSVLGEASDHLSQASIVDLTVHMEEAESTSSFTGLRALLARLPAAFDPARKVQDVTGLEERANKHRQNGVGLRLPRTGADADTNADVDVDAEAEAETDDEPVDFAEYVPDAETREFLWDVLTWRDEIVRTILAALESVPGLVELLEQLMDLLNQCVYTLLAPVLVPIAKEVTLALKEESQAVIDMEEQYEVFDNPRASDPTHSILSKDHVDLILNEPAGRVARVVVEHTVGLVVHAWYNPGDDPERTINEVLEAFFHPYYATGTSIIQNDMLDAIRQWLDVYTVEERDAILLSLTKESVREGANKRVASSAGSSVDTLSSLEGSGSGSGGYGSWASSSGVSRPNSSPVRQSPARRPVRVGAGGMGEAPLERDRERYEEHRRRAVHRDGGGGGGLRPALRNPQSAGVANMPVRAREAAETRRRGQRQAEAEAEEDYSARERGVFDSVEVRQGLARGDSQIQRRHARRLERESEEGEGESEYEDAVG